MQGIYCWQLSGGNSAEVYQKIAEHKDLQYVDEVFLQQLIEGVIKNVKEIDDSFTPHLDRDISKLNPVELAIIRIGCYELIYCPETPYRVAINEAIEVAKNFGAEAGHKYVNSILDKVANDKRRTEMRSGKVKSRVKST